MSYHSPGSSIEKFVYNISQYLRGYQGDSAIEAAARNLIKLKSKLDTTKMKEPSFLMVLTGIGKYPYRHRDGILVIPAGSLKN